MPSSRRMDSRRARNATTCLTIRATVSLGSFRHDIECMKMTKEL